MSYLIAPIISVAHVVAGTLALSNVLFQVHLPVFQFVFHCYWNKRRTKPKQKKMGNQTNANQNTEPKLQLNWTLRTSPHRGESKQRVCVSVRERESKREEKERERGEGERERRRGKREKTPHALLAGKMKRRLAESSSRLGPLVVARMKTRRKETRNKSKAKGRRRTRKGGGDKKKREGKTEISTGSHAHWRLMIPLQLPSNWVAKRQIIFESKPAPALIEFSAYDSASKSAGDWLNSFFFFFFLFSFSFQFLWQHCRWWHKERESNWLERIKKKRKKRKDTPAVLYLWLWLLNLIRNLCGICIDRALAVS